MKNREFSLKLLKKKEKNLIFKLKHELWFDKRNLFFMINFKR